MNIEQQLMAELSRRNTDRIAAEIGDDAEKFEELMRFVFSRSAKLSMRAAWVMSSITDRHPAMLAPYLTELVDRMDEFEHPGTRRNIMRYFSEQKEIPEALQGTLYDMCWKWMISVQTPIAIRAYSMRILYQISLAFPELQHELLLVLSELNEAEMPAIKSVARQIRKKLGKK